MILINNYKKIILNNRININQLIYDLIEYILLKTTTSLIDFSQTITSLCITLQSEVTIVCKQKYNS